MNGYTVKEMILNGASVACTQNSTTAITNVFRITPEDSVNILVRVTVSAISVGTGITLVLQDSCDGSTWATVKSTALSATTNYELENNMFNGSDTAIWPLARIVVVTQGSDTVTLSSALVTRRL